MFSIPLRNPQDPFLCQCVAAITRYLVLVCQWAGFGVLKAYFQFWSEKIVLRVCEKINIKIIFNIIKIDNKKQIDTTRDKPQWIVGHSQLSHLQPPDASKSSAKDLSPSVHEKI